MLYFLEGEKKGKSLPHRMQWCKVRKNHAKEAEVDIPISSERIQGLSADGMRTLQGKDPNLNVA